MILKETILSAFTERGTLLQWLKKVESAVNADVLTDISVEQVSATQVKLKFTFENGDFVESPVLTLPRGEKGEPGKDGLDGQGIAATIDVGTVTTGAAGTNASVTNVGTEQHAVLNFVIPRGDKGATGEAGAEGSAGVGFEDADIISLNDGAINITADDNGVNIESSFEVAVGDEILEIPSTMYLPVKGSESIVIDVDESGDFIDVHLDAAILSKINRAVLTPISSIGEFALLGVDTDNLQRFVKLGDGLSYNAEFGLLSATSSGGGGGGEETVVVYKGFAIDVRFVSARMLLFGEKFSGYGWQDAALASTENCAFAVAMDNKISLTSGDAYYFDGTKVSGRITQYKPFFLASNITVMDDDY